MDISQVRIPVDLVNFVYEKDVNKNGVLEPSEAPELAGRDQDGNGVLSPYEVMEAAPALIQALGNAYSTVRELVWTHNQRGEAFPYFYVEASDVSRQTRDVEIRGIRFKKETMIDFSANGALSAVDLPANTSITIGGIRLRGDASSATVNADGTRNTTPDVRIYESSGGDMMVEGTLDKDYTAADGTKFKAGQEITYITKADGSIQVIAGTLANPTTIRGVSLPAGTKISLGKYVPVYNIPYEADEHVWSATLPEDSTIPVQINGQEVQVGGHIDFIDSKVTHATINTNWSSPLGVTLGPDSEIWLDGNGQVDHVRLGTATPIGGTMFNAGTVLYARNGKIISVETAGETRIGNLTLPAGSRINYCSESGDRPSFGPQDHYSYQSGDIYTVTVGSYGTEGATATYRIGSQDIQLRGGGSVYYFYPNGMLQYGFLVEDTTFNVNGQPVKFKAGTQISFFPDGRVWAGTLADDEVNPNINPLFKFKPGTWIVFHQNGNVHQGTLAEARSIPQLYMNFTAGQQVTFKEDGMPLDQYAQPLKQNIVYVRSEASSGCAFGNRMCIN